MASCEREPLHLVLVSVNAEVLQLPSSGSFRMTALVRRTIVTPGLKPIFWLRPFRGPEGAALRTKAPGLPPESGSEKQVPHTAKGGGFGMTAF